MLTKEKFVERVLRDQRERKEREILRHLDWHAYQSDKGVRIRTGAFKRARGPARRRRSIH